MKILCLSVSALLSVAAPVAGAAERFDPCSLLAKSEIEEVQKDRVTATKASVPERDHFAVSQCFYTLATFSKSISLEITRRRPGETESPRARWKQMFSRAIEKGKEREDAEEAEQKAGGKEKERETAARPRPVSGIGDEAFWDGSSLGGGLYVLKGDAYFRVSVGGPDPETVKIEKLKKLSRHALARLR